MKMWRSLSVLIKAIFELFRKKHGGGDGKLCPLIVIGLTLLCLLKIKCKEEVICRDLFKTKRTSYQHPQVNLEIKKLSKLFINCVRDIIYQGAVSKSPNYIADMR